MSADNWSVCPRCYAKLKRITTLRKREVIAAYGKVSEEEYNKLRLKSKKPLQLEDTLREDFEQGVDKLGEYFVDYSCSCTTCDYSYKYSYKCQTKV